MATTLNKIINHKAAWHLIDAKGQLVGRLANQIAPILRGKHKPTFCPNDDCGDFVVVINASEVEFSGDKWTKKVYKYHTGYPGGRKERRPKFQIEKKPEEVLRRAVMGMLAKNTLRHKMTSKLRIFPGPNHAHEDKLVPGKAECILMDIERTFKNEVQVLTEEEEAANAEHDAEWMKFKEEASAWQIDQFGEVLGKRSEEAMLKVKAEEKKIREKVEAKKGRRIKRI